MISYDIGTFIERPISKGRDSFVVLLNIREQWMKPNKSIDSGAVVISYRHCDTGIVIMMKIMIGT